MASLAEEIYRTRTVHDAQGNAYPLRAQVDPLEGRFIADLITSRPSIRRTLEIGCAFGLSSLHICCALKGREGAEHIIIDPAQSTNWHGVGVENLRRAGIDFFTLIEEGSQFALPRLAKDQPASFDLVFIDGWHTFDHTLLDLFYANLLVKVGGLIIVDDCSKPPVAKAISYFSSYPAYDIVGQSPRSRRGRAASAAVNLVPRHVLGSLLPRTVYDWSVLGRSFATMVALQKVAEDERGWNWFVSF